MSFIVTKNEDPQAVSEIKMILEANEPVNSEETIKFEQRLFKVSVAGSIVFLILEAFMALQSGSRAVLMDAVFDVADMIMLAPFLILIPLLHKPENERRPFGFAQIESLFILIKCIILFCVTADMIFENVKIILGGGATMDGLFIAIYEGCLSLACFTVYLILMRNNKTAGSPSLETEIYIWKLDALSTMGVAIGFLIQVILEHTSWTVLVPYIDSGIALIVAVLLIKEPIEMFITELRNLILFSPKDEESEEVRTACTKILDEAGYATTVIDLIKTGRKLWVDIYVIPKEGTDMNIPDLALQQAKLYEEISADSDDIFIDIIPDLEHYVEGLAKKHKAEVKSDIQRSKMIRK